MFQNDSHLVNQIVLTTIVRSLFCTRTWWKWWDLGRRLSRCWYTRSSLVWKC